MWPLLAAAGKALAGAAAKAGAATAAEGAASSAAAAAAKTGAAGAVKATATQAAVGATTTAAPAAAPAAAMGGFDAAAMVPPAGGGGGATLKPTVAPAKPTLKPHAPPGTMIPPMPGGKGAVGPMETVLPDSALPSSTAAPPVQPPTAVQQVGFWNNLLDSTTRGAGRTLGLDNVSPLELGTSGGRSGLLRGAVVNQFDNLLGGRLTSGLQSIGLPDTMSASDIFRFPAPQRRRQPGQP